MLKRIGAVLCLLCRQDDIACRFGGDEFILLLKNIPSASVAEQRARDIIESVTKLSTKDKRTIACSVGICICRNDTKDIEAAIQKADIALYTAKCNGKNRFFTYGG